jgi:hypothetical protein
MVRPCSCPAEKLGWGIRQRRWHERAKADGALAGTTLIWASQVSSDPWAPRTTTRFGISSSVVAMLLDQAALLLAAASARR